MIPRDSSMPILNNIISKLLMFMRNFLMIPFTRVSIHFLKYWLEAKAKMRKVTSYSIRRNLKT